MQTNKSDVNQLNNSKLTLQVMNDLTVQIFPNENHEFLMTTKEVAKGYGTSKYAVYKTLERHSSEMIEGKHFIKGIDILSTPLKDNSIQSNSFLFTKRGIVRLGFFIKSERAKLFRDWAEELIIKVSEAREDLVLTPAPALPQKRKHNRLTPSRMVEILADVAKIEDSALRLSLISKLGV